MFKSIRSQMLILGHIIIAVILGHMVTFAGVYRLADEQRRQQIEEDEAREREQEEERRRKEQEERQQRAKEARERREKEERDRRVRLNL